MRVRFRPRLIPTLCTIALAPILFGLGMWQTDRSAQRAETHELFTSRAHLPSVNIGASLEAPSEVNYRHVSVTGTWDQSREFFLDNQVLNGRAGVHVITPLVMRGGNTAVLVNRGWMQSAADRSILPQTEDLSGAAEVSGIAVIPPEDVFTLEDEGTAGTLASPVWQVLDLNRFSEIAPYQIQAFVIQLDAAHPNGFERQWKPPSDEWIYRHKAYAFQWFALCAALLVIYFLFAFRPQKAS